MYLPSIGPFLLAGLLAVYIYNKSTKNNGLELYQKVILYSSILISISMLSYSTIKQSRVWKDSITLWSHEISVDPTFPGHITAEAMLTGLKDIIMKRWMI